MFLEKIHIHFHNVIEKHMEHRLENKFSINTKGYITLNHRVVYANYAPSPYHYLWHYFKKYRFSANDCYVDFGSGLGRTVFLTSYLNCNHTIGVDINPDMHRMALQNLTNYKNVHETPREIEFVCQAAQNFFITPKMTHFYFYNPFHLKYFIKVIRNIIKSYEEKNRTIEIILYCPAEEYTRYLQSENKVTLLRRVKYKDNAFFMVYTVQ